MTISVASIARETNARACVECGKCSAACSMAAMYPDFSAESSPRGMVQTTLRQAMNQNAGVNPAHLWRCLQCGNCTAACPENVDCAGLIAKLRAIADDTSDAGHCDGCGREIPALPVREWLRNTLDPHAPATAREGEDEGDPRNTAYLRLCPVCRRQVYAANNAAGQARQAR